MHPPWLTTLASVDWSEALQGGIKVEPKFGSAILWPSTLDSEPMRADERTLHEAMPVLEGIKYGANMWVHQFRYSNPTTLHPVPFYYEIFPNIALAASRRHLKGVVN